MQHFLFYNFLFLSFFVFSQEISYDNGKTFLTFIDDNIGVSMNLSKDKQYQKYYVADIIIYNNSAEAINFNPKGITSSITRKDVKKNMQVLSHKEFIKKVKSAQKRKAFAQGLSNAYAVKDAGKTTTRTRSTTNSKYTGTARTNYNNKYGNNIGSSNTTGTVSGRSITNSTTTTEDGAVKYLAEQNANKQLNQMKQHQSQIANILSQGYLKAQTLNPQDFVRGKVNIQYRKADLIEVVVPINGKEYSFVWDKELLQE